MLTQNRLLPFFILILISFFIISACGNVEDAKTRHLQRAKQYMHEENFDKAKVELKNVLQIDPKSAESYRLLGEIEEHNQNWHRAISNYYKAIELAPNILEPHIKLGRFFIQQAADSRSRNDSNNEDIYLKKVKEHVEIALQIKP